MKFEVYYSDEDYTVVNCKDAKAAYKHAAKSAIGRYITQIYCCEYNHLYYSVKTGFVDPHEKMREIASKFTAEEVAYDIIRNRTRRSSPDGYTFNIRTDYNEDGLPQRTYSSADGHKIISFVFSVEVKIPDVAKAPEEKAHAWSNGACTNCGADLFEIENPSGICEG